MKRITIDFRHKAVIRDVVGNRMSLGYGREGIEQDLVPCIGSYVQIEIYLRIEGERATFLEYRGKLEKVNLGSMDAFESVGGAEAPSEFNGFFYQTPQMMPDQAGTIGRFYVIGQFCTKNPRLDGQLH